MHNFDESHSERTLLVAACEALARHMNGRAIWQLMFLSPRRLHG